MSPLGALLTTVRISLALARDGVAFATSISKVVFDALIPSGSRSAAIGSDESSRHAAAHRGDLLTLSKGRGGVRHPDSERKQERGIQLYVLRARCLLLARNASSRRARRSVP